jgi:AcrR family transcriptional regulator
MSNNVDTAHKDVNAYISSLGCAAMAERPYHHGNLRTALLEQAEKTVRERGVQDLSLRELAREIGVSHGAPRRHFADRQALLAALAEAGFERLGVELRAAADEAGGEFAARLRAIATAYARFAIEDAALLELMFAGKQRDPAGPLHVAADQAFSVVLELIHQGQAEGALEPGDPERVGLVLFATIQGVATLVGSGMVHGAQLDEVLDDAVGLFLRGARA